MVKPVNGVSVTGNPVSAGLAIPPAGAATLPHYGAPLPPQPDVELGQLWVGESISWKTLGGSFELDFLFNQALSTEVGQGWTTNVHQFVVSMTNSPVVTISRCDQSSYGFQWAGKSGAISTYTAINGAATTLSFNGAAFTEYYPDGHRLTYGEPIAGVELRLSGIADPSGNLASFTFVSPDAGQAAVSGIEFPGGQLVTLAYNLTPGAVRLNTITDFGNRVFTFGYSSGSSIQPISFTRPNGCESQYTSSASNMTQHTDASGYATVFTAGGVEGQPSVVQGGSGLWTYTWDAGANIVQLPTGGLITYNFNSTTGLVSTINHPEGYTETVTWDANGRKVMSVTPAGTVFSVAYDPVSGQVQTQWDGTGNAVTALHDVYGNVTTLIAANGYPVTMTYAAGSASRNPVHVVDADGVGMTYTYLSSGLMQTSQDGRGLVTTFGWDSFGNLTTQKNPDGGIRTNTYDALNRRISATDELSRTTTTAYDLADNVVAVTDPTGAINTYAYQNCLLVAEVNPLNYRNTYTYDRFQNRVTSMDALGNVTTAVVDLNGYVVATIDPLGHYWTQVFNGARQMVATQDPNGHYQTNIFDNAGRQVATQDANGHTTTQVLDAQSRVLATVDALGNRATSVYAAAGFSMNQAGMTLGGDASNFAALSYQVQPMGFAATTVFTGDGRTLATVDPLACRTTNAFDAAGNQVTTQDANDNVTTTAYQQSSTRVAALVNPLGAATSFTTDVAGQEVARTNAKGGVITFEYNKAGRQTVVANELGYVTTTTYDTAGRPTAATDALGRVRTQVFDGDSRLTNVRYSDGTILTQQWDAAGRLTTMTDWGGPTTYAYSPRNQLVGKTEPGALVQAYAYDGAKNRVQLVDPDGGVYTYSFDQLNRQIGLVDRHGRVYTAAFDPNSRLTTMTTGMGAVEVSGYDAKGQLTSLIELNAALHPISTIVCTFDPGGRKALSVANGTATTYQHDAASRLTSQLHPTQSATMQYDTVGNPLVKWYQSQFPTTMAYDAAQRIVSSTYGQATTTYSFDNVGNMRIQTEQGAVTGFVYDCENRLLTQTNPDGSISTYAYAGNGLRRSNQEPGQPVHTAVWDDQSNYLGEIY